MGEILDLDQERLDVTVVFEEKQYAMIELDSRTLAHWGRQQRSRLRMQSRVENLEKNQAKEDLPDQQYANLEKKIQDFEDKLHQFGAKQLAQLLEGMDEKTASRMTLRQQGAVFKRLGQAMREVTANIEQEMETEEGEESQP